MQTDVVVTLNEISCRNSGDFFGGTNPYIWPMLLWVDNKVNSTCAPPESFRTNLGWGMKRGQTAAIPPEVGILRGTIDGDLRAMLLVVPLLERSNSSDDMMRAAFEAYCTELPQAVSDNLAKLADPASRGVAIKAIPTRWLHRADRGPCILHCWLSETGCDTRSVHPRRPGFAGARAGSSRGHSAKGVQSA